jgi:hypothetical protein
MLSTRRWQVASSDEAARVESVIDGRLSSFANVDSTE